MPNPILPTDEHHFNDLDQQRFARLSGDVNPMHVDAVAARRLVTGRPVVHGIHTLLHGLERLPAGRWPVSARLECEFLNPVCVGDTVDFSVQDFEGGGTRILGDVGGLTCTRVSLTTGTGAAPYAIEGGRVEVLPLHLAEPLTRDPSDWPGTRQSLPLPSASFATIFPSTCAVLGERRVAALAALSTYVGMVCPGLHSIFSSLICTLGDDSAALRFEVRRYDPRFRIFIVAFDGCLRGELKAFLRPPPQRQLSSEELVSTVEASTFAGSRAWVIGGSRGLGELCAKILGAGGAQVILTYANGEADAQRVATDINDGGRGRAQLKRFDVAIDDASDWMAELPSPDLVLYFATPRIFRKRTAVFQPSVLQEFMDFYVLRFEALCRALQQKAQGAPVAVLCPSTIFIEQRPKGMTEYAMAKAAAELMIEDLGPALAPLRMLTRRLPRLATDQTAAVFAGAGASNIDALLPVILELQALQRGAATRA